MIRLIGLAFMAACCSYPATARLPRPQEFTNRSVDDAALGTITWHVDTVNPDVAGPLVVWLPGSGALPFFQKYADGDVGFALPPPLFEHMNQAHFMLVDKPGIPFEAQVGFDAARGRPIELDNPVYRAGLTKDQLVARTAVAIENARKALGSRASSLVLIGGSEGAQYAFALAKQVKANLVIAWGGIALPQYFDMVLEQRLAAERGEITRDQAQANVERIYQDIKSVQRSPYDTKARFDGETYRRWSGFGNYYAINDMLDLDVPLLLMQGGADQTAPIINTDFAKIVFLSRGKQNLDYWVFPNVDHSFNVVGEKNKIPLSMEKEIWYKAWQWLEDHQFSSKTTPPAP